MNNRLGKRNAVKLEAVHEQVNGTTSALTNALATEQVKNADLQKIVTAAIPKRSTDQK